MFVDILLYLFARVQKLISVNAVIGVSCLIFIISLAKHCILILVRLLTQLAIVLPLYNDPFNDYSHHFIGLGTTS